MKYLAIIILSFVFALPLLAQDTVPFANEFVHVIKNYNRATPTLATSGTLGEGAVQELAEKGFSTIIDLRTMAEGTAAEKSAVEASVMSYINIPITGSGVDDAQLVAFIKAFEATDGPVLLHCASGNRVGAMLTRYYLEKGVDRDQAFERGRTAGMGARIEATIE